ncbi:MAG: carboxypeptidase-like regulatory domain-containing protein [Mariniblastus sp.]
MKFLIQSKLTIGLLACFSLAILTGCSNDASIVPVSGTVTLDGDPVPGVLVVFMPQPLENNVAPGPYSEATTDANGKYTMKTRYGDPGACVGTHVVSFSYADMDEEEVASAENEAQESKGEGGTGNSKKAGASEEKSQLKGRKRIPRRYGDDSQVTMTVEPGGTSTADFPLTSK